jgi:hypothetical protein
MNHEESVNPEFTGSVYFVNSMDISPWRPLSGLPCGACEGRPTERKCRGPVLGVTNRQLTSDRLVLMAKKTAEPEPAERPYKTTGVHIPADLWELLNRVAFERSRTKGGRASVSALLVDMIEQHRKELEKELASASR